MDKKLYDVYDEKQVFIGQTVEDKHPRRLTLKATDGHTYSIPITDFYQKKAHLVLSKSLCELVKLSTYLKQQEHIDEMSDESFPASDPPDFTLGKDGIN